METKGSWDFRLADGILSDRSGARTLCAADKASRLVGWLGDTKGGLKPFPGFRKARDLEFESVDGANHDKTSVVLAIKGVDIRYDTDKYAVGFAYLVRRKTSTNIDIYVDLWRSGPGTWTCFRVNAIGSPISISSFTPRFDVVCFGATCYLFTEGQSPARFYLDSGGTEQVSTTPGPGAQPTGTVTVENVASGANSGSAVSIPGGSYALAFVLKNTSTGARSNLSAIYTVKSTDFPSTPDFIKIAPSSLTGWDQIWLYRSLNSTDTGGAVVNAMLLLDSIQTIGGGTSWNYTLKDEALAYQDPHMERQLFDEKMPYGGSGAAVNGVLVVGNIRNTPSQSATANGPMDMWRNKDELRWSTPLEVALEMFSPFSRYLPPSVGSKVQGLCSVGSSVLALLSDRVVLCSRSGSFLLPQQLHEGHGCAGPYAFASSGSWCWFITRRGMRAVNAQGELQDVGVCDGLIQDEWGQTVKNVSASLDSVGNVLMFLNPTEARIVCLWLDTGMMSELIDCDFDMACSGFWWMDPSDVSTPLERRAFFLQNWQGSSSPPTGWKPRVVFPDIRETRIVSGSTSDDGKVRKSIADVTGDLVWTTDLAGGDAGSGGTGTLRLSSSDQVGSNTVGWRVRVLDSSTASKIGLVATVKSVAGPSGGKYTVTFDDGTLDGLPAGSKVAVNPVVCRWESPVLRRFDSQLTGTPFEDMMRQRSIESVGLAVESVGGSTRFRRFGVGGYKGDETAQACFRWASAQSGAAKEGSLERGVSSAFGSVTDQLTAAGLRLPLMDNQPSVFVEIPCCDTSFRLVGVTVQGTITSTDRSSRGS